jgi:DNA-binding beta-propeller fold protein YncE
MEASLQESTQVAVLSLLLQTMTGAEERVDVPATATVRDLREAAERCFQFGIFAYRLSDSDGVLMDDLDAKLVSFGIQDGANIMITKEFARDYGKITSFSKRIKCAEYPNGVLIDQSSGHLFVCHYFGTLGIYDADFTLTRSIKLGGNAPSQMALTPSGELLVAFRSSRTVGVFDVKEGKQIKQIKLQRNSTPSGIAVLGDRVFVADSGCGVVRELNIADGTEVRETSGKWLGANMQGPSGMAIVEDRFLAVADRRANRVLFIALDTLEAFGQLPGQSAECGGGAGESLRQPNDVAVDTGGNLIVMDTGNERIAVFRQDGTLLASVMQGVFKDHGNTFSYLACNHSTGAIAVSNNDEHEIAVLAPLV